MYLRDSYSLQVLDTCNALRCNCYYAQALFETCTDSCKASCLFVEGGRKEIQTCLTDLCRCEVPKSLLSKVEIEPIHVIDPIAIADPIIEEPIFVEDPIVFEPLVTLDLN